MYIGNCWASITHDIYKLVRRLMPLTDSVQVYLLTLGGRSSIFAGKNRVMDWMLVEEKLSIKTSIILINGFVYMNK